MSLSTMRTQHEDHQSLTLLANPLLITKSGSWLHLGPIETVQLGQFIDNLRN